MRTRIIVALVLSCAFPGLNAAVDDNVIALSDADDYVITEKGGKMDAVRQRHVTTYVARHSDDRVLVYEFYGGSRSIDKASAPGAKPFYRTYEDDEIFYDGSRICAMEVSLRKDKPAKVTFELTEKAPEQFCRIFLTGDHQAQEAVTTVTVPQPLADKVRVIPHGLLPGMTLSSAPGKDGALVYTVRMANRPARSHDRNQPDYGAYAPQLFVAGRFADVQDLYGFMRGYVPSDDVNVDDSVRELASALAARVHTPQALADSTAAWVRANIRYYAIEHGDNAFAPAPAAAVLARRSGDCKGSANLIRTLLKLNGVDGRLVWIGTQGHSPFGWDEAPVVGVGNHMIAAAILADSVVYLDGTQRYAFDGYISPSLRGCQALIEDGDRPMLRRVPAEVPVADGTSLRARYTVCGDTLKGHIACTYHGFQRVAVAALLGDTRPARRPEVMNRLLTFGRKNAVASGIAMIGAARAPQLTLEGDVAELGAVKLMADRMYIDLQPLRDHMFEIVDTRGRTSAYQAAPLYTADFDYEVAIPEGYAVKSLPEPCEISGEYFDASLSYTLADSGTSILCRMTLTPRMRVVPLQSLEARNAEARRFRQAAGNMITLQNTNLP